MRLAPICHDKPGHLPTRPDTRAAHPAHRKSPGVVGMAGPLPDADGTMTDSPIVPDAVKPGRARARAGLFGRATLTGSKKVIG